MRLHSDVRIILRRFRRGQKNHGCLSALRLRATNQFASDALLLMRHAHGEIGKIRCITRLLFVGRLCAGERITPNESVAAPTAIFFSANRREMSPLAAAGQALSSGAVRPDISGSGGSVCAAPDRTAKMGEWTAEVFMG